MHILEEGTDVGEEVQASCEMDRGGRKQILSSLKQRRNIPAEHIRETDWEDRRIRIGGRWLDVLSRGLITTPHRRA